MNNYILYSVFLRGGSGNQNRSVLIQVETERPVELNREFLIKIAVRG